MLLHTPPLIKVTIYTQRGLHHQIIYSYCTALTFTMLSQFPAKISYADYFTATLTCMTKNK